MVGKVLFIGGLRWFSRASVENGGFLGGLYEESGRFRSKSHHDYKWK